MESTATCYAGLSPFWQIVVNKPELAFSSPLPGSLPEGVYPGQCLRPTLISVVYVNDAINLMVNDHCNCELYTLMT
jgi:hypothetical protein